MEEKKTSTPNSELEFYKEKNSGAKKIDPVEVLSGNSSKPFQIDIKLSKDQRKAFSEYWESGKTIPGNDLTEKQYAAVPDVIDNIKMGRWEKYALVSNELAYPEKGLAYTITKEGHIKKVQLDEKVVPQSSIMGIKDIEFNSPPGKSPVTEPKPFSKNIAEDIKSEDSIAKKFKDPGQDKEPRYFHQYFKDEKTGEVPTSMVIVKTQEEELRVLAEKTKGRDKGKEAFVKLNDPGLENGDYKFMLVSNKNVIAHIIHNYNAGKSFAEQNINKVFLALNKGKEKAVAWVEEKERQENHGKEFSERDIPYKSLEKIGIAKEDLSKTDIDNMLKGLSTTLINKNLRKEDIEVRNTPPFKINLERREDDKVVAKITFQQKDLDIEKDNIGKTLTPEEKAELKRKGTISEPKFYPNEKGHIEPYKVGVDKETNTIEKKEIRKYDIGSARELSQTYDVELSALDHNRLGSGKSVNVKNISIPDKPGKYEGNIDLNPVTGRAVLKVETIREMKKEKLLNNHIAHSR
ncbi:DUF4099 domain-containing protein [Salegentibacter sp. F188]|uniref:DUF4099 domain-containing protein n=1 Tax=Autumnicola patrickiae TaxID=3075591 RepID=A0ABU3E5H0_9FLAO|nr:DUF4099 domain-containing protein [Salegentibacter sp. F188]MDT0691224.1 DUF4099 domain-containing protein [Salegentibacter sp. F188]